MFTFIDCQSKNRVAKEVACSNRERNTAVHGESKVCGIHFEGGKKWN